jgi:hypothetical protein
MSIPDAMSAIHVKEVPVCVGKVSTGAAPTWPPGRIEMKYGGVPPLDVGERRSQRRDQEAYLKVSCVGWHYTANMSQYSPQTRQRRVANLGDRCTASTRLVRRFTHVEF